MKQKKNYLSHPDANLRANGLGKCYNICEEKYNTIKYNKMRLWTKLHHRSNTKAQEGMSMMSENPELTNLVEICKLF